MAAAENLKNLSPSKSQHFPFQKPFINYIFKNSKLIFSQKVIKCCKFFKILHLKSNQSRLEKLWVFDSEIECDGGLSYFSLFNCNNCLFKIDTSTKVIQILQSLNITTSVHSNYYIINLMPKLDLCQTKKITFHVNVALNRETLDKIIQPSLEKVFLRCYPCKEANPALLVFQRCPKIKNIEIIYNGHTSVLTKNILKDILLIKRENKIESLYFDPISRLDKNDFMKLIDNHLRPTSYIYFTTNEEETFNELKEMLINIKEIHKTESKKDGIKIRFWFQLTCFEIFL